MSSPCASAGPTQRCLCLHPACGPFARVPMDTGEDVGAHTSLIILLEKGIYIKTPERVCHLHPWIGRLKDWHIQSRGHQPFPLPTPSAASAPMPAAHSLTHIEYPSESGAPLSGEEGGKTPPPTVMHWDFGGLPRSRTAPVWG